MAERPAGDVRYRGILFDPDQDAARLESDPDFQPPPTARQAPRYVIWVRPAPGTQAAGGAGPLTRGEVLAFRAQGTRVLEHLGANAYLLSLAPAPTMRALPPTGRVIPLAWRFKVGPSLYGEAAGPTMRAVLTPRDWIPPISKPGTDGAMEVVIELHRDVGRDGPPLEDVLAKVAAFGDGIQRLRGSGTSYRARVAGPLVAPLAGLEGVASLALAREATPSNDVACSILNPGGPRAPQAWRGAGQVVCVNEPGFDDGAIDDAGVHEAFTERDPSGRRVSRVLELVTSPLADGAPRPLADDSGHATHVCGSVAGSLDCGCQDVNGYPVSLCGTAPEARLVVVNLHGAPGTGRLEVPAELASLWDQVYRKHGARVFTCSWNHRDDPIPLYGEHAAASDAFAWDHPDASVLFSAGNRGAGPLLDKGKNTGFLELKPASVKDPGTSKNALCVGAVESVRPQVSTTWRGIVGTFQDGTEARCIATSADRVAPFSGRGPSWLPAPGEDDLGPVPVGRAKPDLVAPGTAIASVETRGLGGPGDAAVAPITDVRPRSPSGVAGAYFLNGTSVATPLVAGCVATVRQWLLEGMGLKEPAASLVKALLVNGATPLGPAGPGRALVDDRPDEGSGFGRVNVAAVVDAAATCRLHGFFEDAVRDVGEEREVYKDLLDPASPVQRLKVTLAWTDAPGEALQSDLDLVVIVGTEERHGNLGASPWFDRANTVEQVDWEAPPSGDVRVLVRAFRLAPDTLDGTRPPQAFHVVVRME